MARWVGRGIALLLLVGIVLFPAIRWPSLGGVERDTATISDYDADFVVTEDGRITVTETLGVNFPDFKHGIFRFFDVQDPGDSHVRLVPRNISVTRDGQAEPFEVLSEGKGRYLNVKIGSPYRTMTGDHTYVIRYSDRGRARVHRRRPGRVLLEPHPGRLADADPVVPADRPPACRGRSTSSAPSGAGATGGCRGEADA